MLQIRKYKRGKPVGQGSCSALKSCASLPAKCKILCSSLDDVLGGDVDNEYGDSRDTEDVCLYVCTLFFFIDINQGSVQDSSIDRAHWEANDCFQFISNIVLTTFLALCLPYTLFFISTLLSNKNLCHVDHSNIILCHHLIDDANRATISIIK
jgi:hypothetical protein